LSHPADKTGSVSEKWQYTFISTLDKHRNIIALEAPFFIILLFKYYTRATRVLYLKPLRGFLFGYTG